MTTRATEVIGSVVERGRSQLTTAAAASTATAVISPRSLSNANRRASLCLNVMTAPPPSRRGCQAVHKTKPDRQLETLAARLAWRIGSAEAPRLCVTAFRRFCSVAARSASESSKMRSIESVTYVIHLRCNELLFYVSLQCSSTTACIQQCSLQRATNHLVMAAPVLDVAAASLATLLRVRDTLTPLGRCAPRRSLSKSRIDRGLLTRSGENDLP